MHKSLERAILESVPRKFVQGLIDKTPSIYLDAYHGLKNDPGLNPLNQYWGITGGAYLKHFF